jgi:hypothetical protein
MRDTGADDDKIRILKRSCAVRPQLHTDTQFTHDVDCIPQLFFTGCIGDHNPGTLLMQKTGGRKSCAAKADNHYLFVPKIHQ